MSGNKHGVYVDPSRTVKPGVVAEPFGEALPFLRRYARTVTGSQASGDAFVRATLEAALRNPGLHARICHSRVELFKVFSGIWNSANAGLAHESGVQNTHSFPLARISPIQRQALALTQLEEFSLADAALVLGVSPDEIALLVDQAMHEIEQDAETDVLIIEDEPLISSHIEAIVEEMGHRVVAIAVTARQAKSAYGAHRPGLVLADIQLADGSSASNAVDEILAMGPVPIVFITAFPEKLLTGERSEPSFLVAKPFREETLRATIGQALFFAST